MLKVKPVKTINKYSLTFNWEIIERVSKINKKITTKEEKRKGKTEILKITAEIKKKPKKNIKISFSSKDKFANLKFILF